MPHTVLLYISRRPDLTPAQFHDYYETKHVPLLQKTFGSLMPNVQRRRYVKRDASPPHAPDVPVGTAEHVWYDCITELVFENEEHYGQLFAKFSSEETGAIIHADEDNFVDRSKIVAVTLSEVNETPSAQPWHK